MTLTEDELEFLREIPGLDVYYNQKAVPLAGQPYDEARLEWERESLEREAWEDFRKKKVVPIFQPVIEEETRKGWLPGGEYQEVWLRLEAYTRPLPARASQPECT